MPAYPASFSFNPTTLAGITLWSLALYLGFSPISDRVIEQLTHWLDSVESHIRRSSHSQQPKESINLLYASLFSIVPFLLVGLLCSVAVEVSLGLSWSISLGILACIGAGVYELGRRDGQASE
ncbi:MAG: hypothetical protein HC881_03815 [Leptolyngbyaceae cyanobacterium SL_7_1]|nr:hypothetical protein [Leptolyngbyaceae cyanobacterium SL_7_1]